MEDNKVVKSSLKRLQEKIDMLAVNQDIGNGKIAKVERKQSPGGDMMDSTQLKRILALIENNS